MGANKKVFSFLAVPNVVIDRIVCGNLTGVEIKVLLLCLRWTIGYNKETCTPTLTALERETGHKRKFLSRVLKSLTDKHFLCLVSPGNYLHQAARYSVPLEWDCPTAVGQIPLEGPLEAPLQSHCNRMGSPTRIGQAVPQEVPNSPTAVGHYIDISHRKLPHETTVSLEPPLPPLQGELRNAEKRASEATQFLRPLKDSRSEKQKTDPIRLIKWFEEETHQKANLTGIQMLEFAELQASCNERLFQVQFIKQMKKIIGVPIPEHLKGPGAVCMLIAKAAAAQAGQNGGGRS